MGLEIWGLRGLRVLRFTGHGALLLGKLGTRGKPLGLHRKFSAVMARIVIFNRCHVLGANSKFDAFSAQIWR